MNVQEFYSANLDKYLDTSQLLFFKFVMFKNTF